MTGGVEIERHLLEAGLSGSEARSKVSLFGRVADALAGMGI